MLTAYVRTHVSLSNTERVVSARARACVCVCVCVCMVQDAAKWCLIIQDALMWQDWPEWMLKQDKAKEERDETGNVVFRGPRYEDAWYTQRLPLPHAWPYAWDLLNRQSR